MSEIYRTALSELFLMERRMRLAHDLEIAMRDLPNNNDRLIAQLADKLIGSGQIKKISRPGCRNLYYRIPHGYEHQIESGLIQTEHSYYLDQNGKVWDPISWQWGIIDEVTYVSRIVAR